MMRVSLPGHSHGTLHNYFEGRAAGYDRMSRLMMRRPLRRIAADTVGALRPDGAVLDVGTGPGWLLVELARLRPDASVAGVDLATDMVETARRNAARFDSRVTVTVGDVADLPFDDASFDVIVSTLSSHHWADPVAGGGELRRVLRPGGQIRIYDLRSSPFDAVSEGATGATGGVAADLTRFPITRLGVPALRRMVLA
jgi:ubiquinone/menaquinone biosynthesis C-methylase UbiE